MNDSNFFRWHKRRILNKTSWPRVGTHTANLSNYYLNSTFKITSYTYFFLFIFCRAEHYDVCISEKIGTHINAPSTYKKGHHNNSVYSVDHIPLDYLVNIPGK